VAYKRNIFLIDPKFQVKFSLLICGIAAASSLAYPIIIYELIQEFAKKAPQYKDQMVALQDNLLIYLSIFQFIYIIGIFIAFIYLTHRIAGPMYKLKNFLRNISDGNAPEKLFFRSGDYFKEVADEYNLAIEALEKRHLDDTQYLEDTITYLNNLSLVVPEDKKPVLNEVTHKLQVTRNRLSEEI
jgi:methyl-accepting chemotaxis protein